MAEKDFIKNFDRMYILHVSSNKNVQERLISSILSGILDIFDDTDVVAEIKPYIDYGSMGLEKAIIKQCYPDFTDSEINAYILGYTEHNRGLDTKED